MQANDYYKILGLPPSATLQEIKAAYRRLAHQYHPDKSGNDLYAAAQFEIIKEAYEVLSNPVKKEYYLQQRWYDQSIGKKTKDTIVTPFTVLKKTLELDKYVSTLDIHRMDQGGLYEYICDILSDETIEKLNAFKEPDVNEAIVNAVLKSSRHLSWTFTKPLAERLTKLRTDAHTVQAISRYIHYTRSVDAWNKYKTWLVLLVVFLISILIYYFSN